MIDRYKVAEIEAASDLVVWCCDEPPGFTPTRPQDRCFVGNIVQAMLAYAEGRLGAQTVAFNDADRIIAIGSDRMMAAVAAARHGVLAGHLDPRHIAIGSINSPMQCMLKEICAQCLQPQVDPATGKTSHVFSCFNQDQLLDRVDFPGLGARLAQNSLQEKLTAQWIDRCLVRLSPPRRRGVRAKLITAKDAKNRSNSHLRAQPTRGPSLFSRIDMTFLLCALASLR